MINVSICKTVCSIQVFLCVLKAPSRSQGHWNLLRHSWLEFSTISSFKKVIDKIQVYIASKVFYLWVKNFLRALLSSPGLYGDYYLYTWTWSWRTPASEKQQVFSWIGRSFVWENVAWITQEENKTNLGKKERKQNRMECGQGPLSDQTQTGQDLT